METILPGLLDQSAGVIIAVLLIWRLDTTLSKLSEKIDTAIAVMRAAQPVR